MDIVIKSNKQGDVLLRRTQKEPVSNRYIIKRKDGETIQLNAYHYSPFQAKRILENQSQWI